MAGPPSGLWRFFGRIFRFEAASQSFSAKMTPHITTIIPTFRRPRLLRRAIASVLEQDYHHLQVCVYDNNSEDETKSIVHEFSKQDARVKYYCHVENIGSLANFIYGMSRVRTSFFSFLSDDDYLLPNFYRRAIEALNRHPQAMFWAGMSLHVDEQGIIWDARVRRWSREGVFKPPEGFMAMTGGMAPAWTSILFRKEAIDQIGLIDIEVGGPSDLDYCLQLAAHHPYILEKYPAAVFMINSQSFSATQPMSAFWPGWKRMIGKFSDAPGLTPEFKKDAQYALQRDARKMLFRRGAHALAAGRLDFARDAAKALEADCDEKTRSLLLRALAAGCSQSTTFQQIYTTAYRQAEKRLVNSRHDLQATYGHLLRPN